MCRALSQASILQMVTQSSQKPNDSGISLILIFLRGKHFPKNTQLGRQSRNPKACSLYPENNVPENGKQAYETTFI